MATKSKGVLPPTKNIWQWVDDLQDELRKDGQYRLAELLEQIPSEAVDGNHGRVDAMVPEALHYARQIKNTWAEVYIRHWHLQSLVLHRGEVKNSLEEAVRLLEFASRPENDGCPQRICATQDIAASYGVSDGPSYAKQRKAVVTETLETIDPTWPCFICLSAEYASALYDEGDYEGTIRFVESQRQALKNGVDVESHRQLNNRVAKALIALGKYEEALSEIEKWDIEHSGGTVIYRRNLIECLALCGLNKYDEAKGKLPTARQMGELGTSYPDWIEAATHLCEAKAIENDWSVGATFSSLCHKLKKNGAHYLAAKSFLFAAQAAKSRGSRAVGLLLLDMAKKCSENFVTQKPDLDERWERLHGAFVAIDHSSYQELGIEDALKLLSEDPEQLLDYASVHRNKDGTFNDEQLLIIELKSLAAVGFLHRAMELSNEYLQDHPSQDVAMFYATTLIDEGKNEELISFLNQGKIEDRAFVGWYQAKAFEEMGQMDKAITLLQSLVDDGVEPHAFNVKIGHLFLANGEYERATEIFDLEVSTRKPGGLDWDRMLAGTLCGKWTSVRDSARRLEIPIGPGEGIIDENFGPCLIQWEDLEPLYAQRTGPCTARILDVSGPDDKERHGEHVAFGAEPIGEMESEDGPKLVIFAPYQTIEESSFETYAIEGARLEQEHFSALLQAVENQGGFACDLGAGEFDVVFDGKKYEGMYATLTLPKTVSPSVLSDLLSRMSQDWQVPCYWLKLCLAAGDKAVIERQLAIKKRYGD